ncbi:response regulator [Achromobacter aegrifaciens]
MRILLVEDDELIGRGIAAGLHKHGIVVHHVGTAAEAEATHSEDTFNALVLDLGLPDRDGMELLASMRAVEPQLPVLILTARDAIEHRLKGLHEGADDYMVKPFDLRELAARLWVCNNGLKHISVVTRSGKPRIDLLGMLLLAGSISSLLFGLGWGGNEYAWTSYQVLGMVLVGCILIGLLR